MRSVPASLGELSRVLGIATAIAVCVGSAVGSGILRTPGEIAGLLPSAGWIFFVWTAGAAVAALDIFILAEWTAAVPRVGGLVAFLREAYGPGITFVFGWMILLITWPGSIAGVSVAIGELVAEGPGSLTSSGTPTFAAHAVAAGVITSLGLLNLLDLRFGARFEISLTILKVTLLAAILAAAVLIPGASGDATSPPPAPPVPTGKNLMQAIGGAMISVIFTFDGYADAVYLSGETRHPQRNLPRALFISLLIIGSLYLFANLAFLSTMGAGGMASSKFVPLEFVNRAFGSAGSSLLSIISVVVMLGAVNSYLLTGPRIARLLAEERLALSWFGSVNKRGIPVVATLWFVVISIALAWTNSYGDLLDFVVPIVSLTTIFIAAGLWIDRVRNPLRPRPFRLRAMPLVVGAQVGIGIVFLVSGCMYVFSKNPWLLVIDVAALVGGFILYFFVRQRTRNV